MTPMPVDIRKERIRKLLRWARKQQKQKDSPIRDVTPLYRQALTLFPLIGEQTAKSYARASLRILQEERKEKKEKGG